MNTLLLIGLFLNIFVSGLHLPGASITPYSGEEPPNCVAPLIANLEILANERLDVNQDGTPDWVYIYIKQDDARLLVAVNHTNTDCQVVRDEYLMGTVVMYQGANTTQKILVRAVELVNVTSHMPVDLHVWLESTGWTSRSKGSLHEIFTWQDNALQRIFVDEHCRYYSSFEFRDNPSGMKDIYWEQDDLDCGRLVSAERDYALYRWNSLKFELIQSGTISKLDLSSLAPLAPYCLGVGGIVLIVFVSAAWTMRRRRLR